MLSTQSAPKRFRIERLEERIMPGFLFWAHDLNVNALTQWGVIEASDSPSPTPPAMAQCADVERTAFNELPQKATSKPERARFPAWAERILQEIEHELNSNPKEVRVHHGITDGVTFFSDFLDMPQRMETKDESFPVWAQELLADLDQRPAIEGATHSAAALSMDEACELDELSPDFQPECEVSRFPAWAEDLLSAVERRIDHDSRMEVAGCIDRNHSQHLNEVICRRLPSATHPPDTNMLTGPQ
jgi:hypothetical protein